MASAADLVNSLPAHRRARYLELGHYNGANFKGVNAGLKESVDTHPGPDPGCPPTHLMTTDAFFAQLDPATRYDVVYIDACHEFRQMNTDFNHAVAHLNARGLIFVHDLVPPSEKFVQPQFCGDSYKFLWHVIEQNALEFYTLDGNYGLSVFVDPVVVNPPPAVDNVGYAAFMALLAQKVTLLTSDEFRTLLATWS